MAGLSIRTVMRAIRRALSALLMECVDSVRELPKNIRAIALLES